MMALSQVRYHMGTIYFPEGTTANQVCRRVMDRQKTTSGLWLMQTRVKNPHLHSGSLEDGEYAPIRDSKHVLQDGTEYVILFYNGPPIFLNS